MSTPFDLVYDGMWSLVESSAPLMAAFRVGNRIRFDHGRKHDPIKREIANADTPELMIVPTGGSGNLLQTSSTSMITRQYDFLIATGDFSLAAVMQPIEFALFAAFTNWHPTIASLEWEGQHFVKRVQLLSVTDGLTDSERNRGIAGWSAIWSVEVEMHFQTSALSAYGEE